ncbi:hypothetical protein [Pedobacter roseus]|uniref:Uncharacterized protein n=1 Tax=Pedobacter roseus TaxID=336820 RepID=A0A7G9QKU5_9SPHI|nr:hypothetical protein [Pedobacter roseus]QNN43970.1 hypothetical protein H9L23_07780 [Pedobacter roseus]
MKKLLLMLALMFSVATISFAATKTVKSGSSKQTVKKIAGKLKDKKTEICLTISATTYTEYDSDGGQISYTIWSLDSLDLGCLYRMAGLQ